MSFTITVTTYVAMDLYEHKGYTAAEIMNNVTSVINLTISSVEYFYSVL